jgi:hypothetical protein
MKTFHPTLDEKSKNKWMKNPTSKLWMKTLVLDEPHFIQNYGWKRN